MRTILSVLFFLIASQSSANVTKKDFDEWRPAEQLAFLAGMGQGFQAVNEALEAKDLVIIKKLIRDVIGDVYRDIWIKRNSWK